MDAPIEYDDLKVFDSELTKEAAEAMITTIWSRVRKLAPCLKDPDIELDEDDLETVKSIMRSVILRWAESGSGVVGSRTAGDYQESYTARGSGGTFRPEEIRDLQSVCAGSANAGNQKAYSVDTGYYAGTRVVNHAAWCSINFVAQPPVNNALCDCGAELSRDGQPLWRR